MYKLVYIVVCTYSSNSIIINNHEWKTYQNLAKYSTNIYIHIIYELLVIKDGGNDDKKNTHTLVNSVQLSLSHIHKLIWSNNIIRHELMVKKITN